MSNISSLVYVTTISKRSSHFNFDNLYLNSKFMSSMERDDNFHYSKINQEQIQIYALCHDVVRDKKGAVSSEIVISHLKRLHSHLQETNELSIEQLKHFILKFVNDANEEVSNNKKSLNLMELGTTFTGFFIIGAKGVGINIGLSECIMLKRKGSLQRIVFDNQGGASKEPYPKVREKRGQYIGVKEVCQLDVQFTDVFTIEPGDIYMLSTRAFTNIMTTEIVDWFNVNHMNNEVLICKRIIDQLNSEHDSTVMALNIDDLIIDEQSSDIYLSSYPSDEVETINKRDIINEAVVIGSGSSSKKGLTRKKSLICLVLIALILSTSMFVKYHVNLSNLKDVFLEYHQVFGGYLEGREMDDTGVDERVSLKQSRSLLDSSERRQESQSNNKNKSQVEEKVRLVEEETAQVTPLEEEKITRGSNEHLTKYKVMEGDYLLKIAKNYYSEDNVDHMVNVIKHLNNIPEDSDIIKVGQSLTLPRLIDDQMQYKVRTGDTVYSIALTYFQDSNRVKDIMNANKIKDSTELRSGDIILLPLK